MSPQCRDVETFLACSKRFHVATLAKTFPFSFPRNVSTSAQLRRRGNVFSMRRCGNVLTWKRQLQSSAFADVETFFLRADVSPYGVSTSTPTTPINSTGASTWKRLTWKRFAPRCPTWKRFALQGKRFHVEKNVKRFYVARGNVLGRRRRGNVLTWKRFAPKMQQNVSTCPQLLVRGNVLWGPCTWKRLTPAKTFPRAHLR